MKAKQKLVWKTTFGAIDLMHRFTWKGQPYLKTSKTQGSCTKTQEAIDFAYNEPVQIRVPMPSIPEPAL